MHRHFWPLVWACCGLLCGMSGHSMSLADEPSESIDYVRQVKPILESRCYACHGALKQEAGLRVDTAAAIIAGGDSGAAITPSDSSASLLLARIASTDEFERMPPEGEPLTAEQIQLIRAWITQGATAPSDEQPEQDPRDHWAFRVPVRPATPTVANSAWVRNPIDAYIAAAHEQHGLAPQPSADRRVWLRRVTLDLTGLPPTPSEVAEFLADDSEMAFERVVTRLLDSPQYGERWGRHWMDIWRYSDWWGLGAEVRNSQKHIWHWRDWIIESLNADTGYDQMLREMLAADELYPNDLDRLRATGFLARQYFKFNRTTWLDGAIEHTGKAMLGLTLNCAKCHDHKYDPLSQEEYYRLRAIFEPYQIRTEAVPGELDFEKNGIPRAFDCNLAEVTYLHIRGDDRNPDKDRTIEPAIPAFLTSGEVKIESVQLPPEAHHPGLRPFVVEAYVQQAEQRIAAARTSIESARAKLTESEQAAKAAAELAAKKAIEETTEEAASAKPAAESTMPAQTAADPPALVHDDFSEARPDLWEMRDGNWSYVEGRLVQSQTGPARAALRLKQPPPADFEARLKYIPRGGQQWKSVGITFDVVEQNEVLAYLSSYAGGPKSQISYKVGANHTYPPNAAQARPVPLDQPHELLLRVRGALVNLVVDGEHSLAYRLPIERRPGALELITFDARAELVEFELRKLSPSVMLAEAAAPANAKPGDAKPTGPLPVEQAQWNVTIAERTLAVAEAELAAVQARAAADRARYLTTSAETDSAAAAEDFARAASRAERVLAAAKADEALARAELAALQAAADKRAEAEKNVAAAKTALDAARQAIERDDTTYTSLRGALKTLENNLENEASRSKPFPTTSTGRRTALANWIAAESNPLTARVAANHIWSRHFGRPMVATVFDFGRKGSPPSHPEMLDWLAVELVENDWSMKHLHRLIVLSNAYRMSSSQVGVNAATLQADPDNRFYWRMNPIRMEAQAVRDSLLHLAGDLDLTMGGPSIGVNDDGSRRRSLYYVHSHNDHQKFLSMFDDANVLECYRRAESIVPQQALALENSTLAASAAAKIATTIVARIESADATTPDSAKSGSASSTDAFLQEAFSTVLCVEPSPDELTLAKEAWHQFVEAAKARKHADPDSQARTNLIHALLNHNDFITIR